MKAIRIRQHGGPEVLKYEDVPVPEPGPDEVQVKLEAVGVNYVDTYHRRGLYQQEMPFTPGMEAGGIVEAIGSNVSEVAPGERVVYAMHIGAYADYAVVPAWRLVTVPDNLEIEVATAAMLQGLTAHYLTHSTYPIKAGDTVLVHAAAGGVGLLLVQMARLLQARVIGTTSTKAKARLALEHGADKVIRYDETDFEEAVESLTDGQGVSVVYDGVGQATFNKGLNCLRPRGYMVLFGQASGPVEPVDPQILNRKGSLFLTRPSLAHYAASKEEVQQRANQLFGWLAAGDLHVRIDRTFPLSEAAAAHRYIESRRTRGKLLLMPQQPDEAATSAERIDQEDPVDESSWESFPASDPPANW